MTSKSKTPSAISAITIWAGIMVSNVSTYQTPLPVCNSCKNRLERDTRLKKRCTLVGGVLAGVTLLGFMTLKDSWFEISGVLFLASLAFVVIVRSILTPRLAQFKGRDIRVRNAAYRGKGSTLTPIPVKEERTEH